MTTIDPLSPETLDQGFWRTLNPDLEITATPFARLAEPYHVSQADGAPWVSQLTREGYFKLDSVLPGDEAQRLAQCVRSIVDIGLPPVFAFVYDAVWQVFGRLGRILEPILDPGYRFKTAGNWIWHIDRLSAGFPPHRDLLYVADHRDGRPAALTVWIPLTEATPLNGCMYVLPTNRDPNYPANISQVAIPLQSVPAIRALPAPAGSVLGWTPSIIHWGAQSSEWAAAPRISAAVTYVRGDFAPPLDGYGKDFALGGELAIASDTAFTFASRLDDIGRAIWDFRARVVENHFDQCEGLFEFYARRLPESADQGAVRQESKRIRGLEHWKRNRLDEAAALFADVYTANTNDSLAAQMLGQIEHQRRKYADSERCFRRWTELQPGNADAFVCLANAVGMQGRFPEALDHYRRAIGINSAHAGAHANMAQVLFHLKNTSEAIKSARVALAHEPGNHIARQLLMRAGAQ